MVILLLKTINIGLGAYPHALLSFARGRAIRCKSSLLRRCGLSTAIPYAFQLVVYSKQLTVDNFQFLISNFSRLQSHHKGGINLLTNTDTISLILTDTVYSIWVLS